MPNPNTAVFPGAIPTDLTFGIAANQATTKITQPLSSTATTVTVERDVFNVPCLVLIDSEIIMAGNKSGLMLTDLVRGFNGTTAAAHIDQSECLGFQFAHHHNQLVAEVIALCHALGPNLDNIVTLIGDTSGGGGGGTVTYDKATFGLCVGADCQVANNLTLGYIVTGTRTLTKAYIYAKTAPTGSGLSVRINKNGTPIFVGGSLTLPAGSHSVTTTLFDITTAADGDILTVDITGVGSTAAGKDVTVVLVMN